MYSKMFFTCFWKSEIFNSFFNFSIFWSPNSCLFISFHPTSKYVVSLLCSYRAIGWIFYETGLRLPEVELFHQNNREGQPKNEYNKYVLCFVYKKKAFCWTFSLFFKNFSLVAKIKIVKWNWNACAEKWEWLKFWSHRKAPILLG